MSARPSGPEVWALVVLCGCAPEAIDVMALHGCGLDEQGEFTALRVRVRGDFPQSSATELVLDPDEHGELPAFPSGSTAITVEGLIGDFSAAVGRSFGTSEDALTVYFAPANSLCALGSTIAYRDDFRSAALGSDAILVGGRDESGELLAEIVHVDAAGGIAALSDHELPAPAVGMSVHADPERERFVVLGGARAGGLFHSAYGFTLAEGFAEPELVIVDDAPAELAHHGAVDIGTGKVVIVGGCTTIDDAGRCAGGVLDRVFELSLDSLQDGQSLPDLVVARSGAFVAHATDGVLFVAGGFDEAGDPIHSVERRGEGEFEIVFETDDPIVGATLVAGDLLVVATADGRLHWHSDAGTDELGQALGSPDLPASDARPLLGVTGDRLLADAYVVPAGSIADEPQSELVDLTLSTPGAPPGQRTDATAIPLADGSVVLAGGRALSGQPAVPFLVRLRPPLDGPDEDLPAVAELRESAFVTQAPGRVHVSGDALVVDGLGDVDEAPRVRAKARGFRSRSFRLDVTAESDPDTAAFVVLETGALGGIAIRLDQPTPTYQVIADADGSGGSCEVDGALDPELAQALVVDQGEVRLVQADDTVVSCTSPHEGAFAVALAASGSGSARFRQLRLARR